MAVPIINLPYLNIQFCSIGTTSPTTLLITLGRARDMTDTYDIDIGSSLTLSTSYVGVNGLDKGTVQPNTLYAVYLIYDPTLNNKVASLLSVAGNVPLLPASNGLSYSAYRRIGWAITSSISTLLGIEQLGNSTDRFCFYHQSQNVLTGGTATTTTSISLSPFVPVFSGCPIIINTYFTGVSAGDTLNLSLTNTSPNIIYKDVCQVGGVSNARTFLMPSFTNTTNSSPANINYYVTNGSVNIDVAGFYDFL